MNTLPRRSARLSQLHQQQTSSTSLASTSSYSSTASSAFPSPADEFAQQQEQTRLHLQAQFLSAPPQFNAPLPSPSATEFSPFLGYLQSQQNLTSMPQQTQQAVQQPHQQQGRNSSEKAQQHSTLEHHNSFSSQHRPNTQAGNNSGQLPPDFLAEAARRAQIACLMRDLGDVTL